MNITYTDGPTNIDQIITAWKEGRPIVVLVEFTNRQIKKFADRDDLRPGRIYEQELRFHDFSTVAHDNKCVLTHRLPIDAGRLAGFNLEVTCDLTDGTGNIEAKKMY